MSDWTLIWTHLPAFITSVATLIVALKTHKAVNGERAEMHAEMARLRRQLRKQDDL